MEISAYKISVDGKIWFNLVKNNKGYWWERSCDDKIGINIGFIGFYPSIQDIIIISNNFPYAKEASFFYFHTHKNKILTYLFELANIIIFPVFFIDILFTLNIKVLNGFQKFLVPKTRR